MLKGKHNHWDREPYRHYVPKHMRMNPPNIMKPAKIQLICVDCGEIIQEVNIKNQT